jgi:hypothetical protein
MTENHPITPPPELVQQLCNEAILHAVDGAKLGEIEVWLIQEAFRAGADQELEACCELLQQKDVPAWSLLRMHRRPKPPSLKEQALLVLDDANLDAAHHNILLRALEQLDD